jgi:hypothetical protein
MLRRLLRKLLEIKVLRFTIFLPFILLKKLIRKLPKWYNSFKKLIVLKADLYAESNMTLRARVLKKQRRKLTFYYSLWFLFMFWSFLMFYDMADEDQFFFVYEFHKWW